MALNLLTSGASSTNTDTYTTASIDFVSGRLYQIAICWSDGAPEGTSSLLTTANAGAVTLVNVPVAATVVFDTIASNAHRIQSRYVVAASTFSSAISITFGDACTGCAWFVWEVTDPHGTPFPQGDDDQLDASTSINAVLTGALASTSNYQVAVCGHDLNSTSDTVSGTDWTQPHAGVSYATPDTGFEIAFNTSGVKQTATFSGAGAADRATLVWEIATAGTGTTVTSTLSDSFTFGELLDQAGQFEHEYDSDVVEFEDLLTYDVEQYVDPSSDDGSGQRAGRYWRERRLRRRIRPWTERP